MSSRSGDECSKLKCNSEMDKDVASSNSVSANTATSPDNSLRNAPSEKKKKSIIIPKIFGTKRTTGRGGSSDEEELKVDGYGFDMEELDKRMASRENAFPDDSPYMRKISSEKHSRPDIEGLDLSYFEQPMAPVTFTQMRDLRVFVGTWNLGGNTPNSDLNLEDFLLADGLTDIYVVGFQEIVPLNAGNVLVVEDNEPAAKWLNLINQALNKPPSDCMESSDSEQGSRSSNKGNGKETKVSGTGTLPFFQKRSVKGQSKNFRVDSSLLKTCNCPVESPSKERRRMRKLSDPTSKLDLVIDHDIFMDELQATAEIPGSTKHLNYLHVASKQMVGIFLSIWTRRELVPHIGHLRISTVGTGIMGRLRNKGCISISMSLHQTSFCFVCSHLASGEKEGDELKRNADVIEILKSTQFSKIGKNPCSRAPEKIVDHDRIIWLGDLNYRVSMSYEETKVYLEDNDWDTLLEKDQLNMEREAGRVFDGFNEGRILFAPTYKYSHNSDSYAGETTKSKKKRRTPAWCDRILWRGEGIEQSFYIRGESRFSDHRPVCAVFLVKVGVRTKYSHINRLRKGYSCSSPRQLEFEDSEPQRHSFYD